MILYMYFYRFRNCLKFLDPIFFHVLLTSIERCEWVSKPSWMCWKTSLAIIQYICTFFLEFFPFLQIPRKTRLKINSPRIIIIYIFGHPFLNWSDQNIDSMSHIWSLIWFTCNEWPTSSTTVQILSRVSRNFQNSIYYLH